MKTVTYNNELYEILAEKDEFVVLWSLTRNTSITLNRSSAVSMLKFGAIGWVKYDGQAYVYSEEQPPRTEKDWITVAVTALTHAED